MLPLLVNDNPTRLVQVSMTGSVGFLGKNNPLDVTLIQNLLNLVRPSEGGSVEKLQIDGAVGNRTIKAIIRFQNKNTKISDGRIDPYGQTIKKLVNILNDRFAIPSNLISIGTPSKEIVNALTGTCPNLGIKSALSEKQSVANSSVAGVIGYTGRIGWKLSSSSSGAFTLPIGNPLLSAGVTVINFQVKNAENLSYWLSFVGIGLAVGTPSKLPAGASLSLPSMMSIGSDIYKINALLGKDPPVPIKSFEALPTSVLAGDLTFWNAGIGTTVIMFGAVGIVAPGVLNTRYFGAMAGQEVGTPSGSLALWIGAIVGYL
jgi:hypothetical protein